MSVHRWDLGIDNHKLVKRGDLGFDHHKLRKYILCHGYKIDNQNLYLKMIMIVQINDAIIWHLPPKMFGTHVW